MIFFVFFSSRDTERKSYVERERERERESERENERREGARERGRERETGSRHAMLI